ncbi:hypothetical protein [Jannaschia rubra]|uniref:Uncharacterized protein n=1 Tax=Jannaschia rubra TaxID=282197 RepID=A0A0M6XNS2_9RHOB|nr:hypothetical protein [Jannaschia rubra]CTQ31664.1 hypothetical protein JAN5088_00422 [Jannaschia rubra]SFG82438.1 hypothetical protein SAMN04488517_11916 [Jannaschia rubra]
MNFVRSIFGAVDRRYLVRAYVISAALLAYMIWAIPNQAGLQGHQKALMFGWATLTAILFPFAKLVWDELRDMLMGNTGFVHFGWWAIAVNYTLKIMVNVVLWFFAIGIAPLGVLYLWLRNRSAAAPVE